MSEHRRGCVDFQFTERVEQHRDRLVRYQDYIRKLRGFFGEKMSKKIKQQIIDGTIKIANELYALLRPIDRAFIRENRSSGLVAYFPSLFEARTVLPNFHADKAWDGADVVRLLSIVDGIDRAIVACLEDKNLKLIARGDISPQNGSGSGGKFKGGGVM